MEHVRLGRTGLKVSRLCLGTAWFGSRSDEERSRAILAAAAAGGITFLDTADVYGASEDILGRWLVGRRHDFIVATKCFGSTGERLWDRGNSRKHILAAIDASLMRLQTDYVDLYQLHNYDPETPIDETLRALEDIVRSGRARYIGVSNWLAYQLARANGRAEALDLTRFDSVQPRYNLLFREIERELLPLCSEDGIAVLPYNPHAGGLLTGKHRLNKPADGTYYATGESAKGYRDLYWHEREFAAIDEIRVVADEACVPMTQLAVAWLLANPVVTAPIIGPSHPDQLHDSLRAAEQRLSPDVKQRLDDITHQFCFGDTRR
jgi:1-deoxyxylulose-5-phosphate synthase